MKRTVLVLIPSLCTLLIIALQYSCKRIEKPNIVPCESRLKHLGISCLMYSGDNEGYFPSSLSLLASEGYQLPSKLYLCPDSNSVPRTLTLQEIQTGKSDYLYFGQGLRDDNVSANTVVLMCDKPLNHGNWMNCVFIDGHVDVIEAKNLEEARRKSGWTFPKLPKVYPSSEN